MQLALHPSAAAGLNPDSPWVNRRNKILIGSVAALSASVIAVSPAAQNGASLELHQAQQRAIQMVAEVTDSPVAVYGDLINDTVYNVSGLLKTYAANPLPILSAIVSNQVGYLKRIFDFSTASTAFQTWWESGSRESAPGKDLLASVESSLASGDIGLAYENFNKLALFGIQNTVLPWLNGWFFGTADSPSIFTQMAQNLTNASTAFFSTGTLVYGAFQAVYAPFSGATFELSRALGTVGSSLGSGNILAAVNALVNTPGAVLNAFLNGFDYSDTQNPWAGLLSWRDPSCTGRCASGGPISEFAITIAQKIAAAIKNVTPAAAATAAAAATVATASSDVASTAVVPAANTVTLTVTDSSPAAAETAEDTTPATDAVAEATPAANSKAASVTTAASTEAEPAGTSAESSTDTPKADTPSGDTAKADTSKGDTSKGDTAKSDTAKGRKGSKADGTKTDSTRSHGTKSHGTKSNETKSQETKSNETKSDSTPSGTAKTGGRHSGTSHAGHTSTAGSSSSGSSGGGES